MPETIWVTLLHAEPKTSSRGDYYLFIGSDENNTRYKIMSDLSHKVQFVHYLAALKSGKEIMMPVVPRSKEGWYQIDFRYVDRQPLATKELLRPRQTSVDPVKRNFSTMPNTKRQGFTITEDYARKADTMVKRLNYGSKSDFYADAMAHYIDLCEHMDQVC